MILHVVSKQRKYREPERLYISWIKNLPKEARVGDVKTLLNHFFPGMWGQKRSSHVVIRCEKLKSFPDYGPFGEISIPVKGGQKVKGFYIKRLVRAIALLRELRDDIW